MVYIIHTFHGKYHVHVVNSWVLRSHLRTVWSPEPVKTPKELYGRSDNNKIVNFPSAKNMIGKFTNVMITEIRTNTLYGEIV